MPLISNKLLKKDSKSELQEFLHSRKIPLPSYVTRKSTKNHLNISYHVKFHQLILMKKCIQTK